MFTWDLFWIFTLKNRVAGSFLCILRGVGFMRPALHSYPQSADPSLTAGSVPSHWVSAGRCAKEESRGWPSPFQEGAGKGTWLLCQLTHRSARHWVTLIISTFLGRRPHLHAQGGTWVRDEAPVPLAPTLGPWFSGLSSQAATEMPQRCQWQGIRALAISSSLGWGGLRWCLFSFA